MAKYKGKFEKGSASHRSEEYSSEASRVSEPKKAEASQYPGAAPKKKKKKMSTPLKIVLIALLVIALLAGGAWVYANQMLNKIDRTQITGNPDLSYADLLKDEETHDEADSTDIMSNVESDFAQIQSETAIETGTGIVNYLVIGSDRRDDGWYGNSDAMIIVSINKDTGKIHLTSLMRAMYVNIPRSSGATWGMLNWSYAWGGPDLLIQTIQNNFKVQIDHYVAVDFSSFQQVVDSVGGVTLDLTAAEAKYVNSQIDFSTLTEGKQVLDGEQALSYARCRDLDNDFMRTHRQRNVITAVINKATSMNVSQLTSLANALFPAVNTDMSNADILSEVVKASAYKNYPIDQLMLPIENQAGTSYTGIMYVKGAEMYAVDLKTNLPALKDFITS